VGHGMVAVVGGLAAELAAGSQRTRGTAPV